MRDDRRPLRLLFVLVLAAICVACANGACADPLDDLASDFWTWRAIHQPVSGDDIPRIDRPANWLPDWSRASIDRQRQALATYESRWRAIDVASQSVARQIDYRLIGSALARVRWELDIVGNWRRDPAFYVHQTVGSVYELLLPPPPFDDARASAVLARLGRIPATIQAAQANLDAPVGPFATLVIQELDTIGERLTRAMADLARIVPPAAAAKLPETTTAAVRALESYREWLRVRLPGMSRTTSIGRDRYAWFLSHVALVPYTPDELLAMGRQEWDRAVQFEKMEKNRHAALPELPLFPNVSAQIEKQAVDERAVRRFLEEQKLLTVPSWVKHYRNLPRPVYIAQLTSSGVTDDLTGPSRLDQDATHYLPDPSPALPYFYLSMARDPRAIIVHEGVPGHYFQLALSWRNPDPIRRHYYDSGSNEGIGFYAEEMMLQAGLFDDLPRSREVIYNFMRLRALRVEADVRLAIGDFTIEQAADYLHRTVPMDRATARDEAASFAGGPGQAITYQIGKLQIYRMMADAIRAQGDAFDLRGFHDFIWTNGNVPLSLQRWELLGLRDDIETVDAHAKATAAAGRR